MHGAGVIGIFVQFYHTQRIGFTVHAIARRGLGELACHHIALAAPQRLIVFGNTILPLLGHDPANKPAAAAQFQHGGITAPLLAARDLAVLLEKPRWKAGFWQTWLDWNGAA